MEILFIVVALIFGIILGIITGLTPGIHINLVASIIVAYSYYILKLLNPITITITITAMAVTHTIFDIIPSTLLGIPNSENLTILLPAHKLTIEGKAKLAILYGLIGSLCGILTTIVLSPLIIKVIPNIYSYLKNYIALILIITSLYVIQKNKNKLLGLIFFITTGILGILSFNIKTIDQPLLPLLSGLFGLSALILSVKNDIKLKEQDEEVQSDISKRRLLKYSAITTLSSFLTNFLPGLTSSHTALISNKINKVEKQEEYIILSNAASSSAIIISFIALFAINKARSGAVITIQYLISSINLTTLILVMSISLIVLSISTSLAIKMSNKIIRNINKINYKILCITIIILIILIVFIITKLEGLLILFTSASIGILAERLNIERINLTGCLILPVILYLI